MIGIVFGPDTKLIRKTKKFGNIKSINGSKRANFFRKLLYFRLDKKINIW